MAQYYLYKFALTAHNIGRCFTTNSLVWAILVRIGWRMSVELQSYFKIEAPLLGYGAFAHVIRFAQGVMA